MNSQSSNQNLVHIFQKQVLFSPDKIAVKYKNKQLTYAELERLSNRIAAHLQSQRPENSPPQKILIALERSHLTIAAILAIVKSGNIYVPFDPQSPDERLRYILDDAGCSLMLTSREYRQRQNQCPEMFIEDLLLTPPAISSPLPNQPATDPVYIMYTSGSTGQPKGVVIPQQGIIRLVIETTDLKFPKEAILIQCGNIAFDASTLEIWGALLNGATLVVVPYETVIDSTALAALLRQENITDAFFTVALFNQLVMENPAVFGGLKNVFSGGDALNPNAIRQALDSASPPENIWNAYGPTENSVITTLHRIRRGEGELYTSGRGLAVEYINKPGKTQEAFVSNPFYAQEQRTAPQSATPRMYKTGDRVRLLADGTLDFMGRVDNQVKIRGFRLEPGEVEFRLSELPMVELAAVDVFVHNGEKQLAAWCQSRASVGEILEQFRLNAPAYMIPTSLQVVEKLPLTPNGKVDKRNLPPVIEGHIEDYVAAQSSTEIALDTLWQQLLKLSHPAGRHGHFFLLGGHSLLVVKLRQAIAQQLGKDVTIAELFRHPELASMAKLTDDAPADASQSTLPRVEIGAKVPLSDEQKRLWLSCIRAPEMALYSIPLAFHLRGKLDTARLARALEQLGERHHSLRLRIDNEAGMPWQQVSDTPVSLHSIDAPDNDSAAEKLQDEMRRPFRFGDDPLLRACVFRVAGKPTFLLFNFHHIITDGWSMGVFFRELAGLYASDAKLPALEHQFTDYCSHQQERDTRADLTFWREQLQDVTSLELPFAVASGNGTVTRQRVISQADVQKLQQAAIVNNIGMFTLCYSALALLLSRLCGQSDIPVSSIWANRPDVRMADQIGFFANTLILRTEVTPDAPLGDWLQANQQILTQSFEHGSAPLSEVLLNSGIGSGTAQHPLCSVLLVLQNTEGGDGSGLVLEGCPVTLYPPDDEPAKSDLLFNIVTQDDGQMRVDLSFRQGICPESLQRTLMSDYLYLLNRLTADSHQPLSTVMDISPAQQQQQLIDWNPAQNSTPPTSILAHFRHWVEATPDAVAVRDPAQSYTYQLLDHRARHLAAQLQKNAGSLKGKKIAFALDRDADTVAVMLAILLAGGVYVPFDPAHPDERLAYVLEDSGAALLITTAHHANRQTQCAEYLLETLLSSAPEIMLETAAGACRNPVSIMYTSGSTGAPKGVEVPEKGILRLVIDAAPYQITRSSVVAQAGNIAFDAATLEIWGALLNGAELVVIPYETVIDSHALSASLKNYAITDAWFTVALFNQLASENPQAFGGLKNLLIGGDALTPSLIAAVLDSGHPPQQVWNGYGPTENTTFTTLHPVSRKDCQRASIPIGKAISGTTCYVLDPHRHLLPVGMAGELYTSGDGVAKGYLNKAEKTAEVFMPNPFWKGEQEQTAASPTMYKTGDKVRWLENGTLEFLGRVDNQVKIRGYRLDPGEVEYQLCQMDDVKQAVVSVMMYQEQKHLVAWCVSPRPSSEILSAFRQRAPAYMVPTVLQCVGAFPLTANGKTDKTRLPAVDFEASDVQGTPPQGETECLLAEIWQQLLKTSRLCCREDNFFAIGGHSLLVIKMTDLIQQQTGKQVSVATVFKCNTLAELATSLDGKHDDSDLQEEAMIAEDGVLEEMHFPALADRTQRQILLTGASGFLGIYLLVTLQERLPEAVVHCVLRGDNALQRLRDNARQYQLKLDEKRIRIVNGDLNSALLGQTPEQWRHLEQTIDTLYHCGAWVNHLHSYTTLRTANVQSTLDLLKLCASGKAKQFFYVSTLSAAKQNEQRIDERELAATPPMKNGYVQSKWVSEKLMAQAFAQGLHGAVYRMGNITGSTRNGISNAQTNHTLNLIKGCLQQGVAPAWPAYRLDISPVDKLAELLVHNSIAGRSEERFFNLGWLTSVAWRTLLSELAPGAVKFVSGETWSREWVPQIQSDNALYPFKSFYLEPQPHTTPAIEHVLVSEQKQKLDVDKVIALYHQFWVESGFLNALTTS